MDCLEFYFVKIKYSNLHAILLFPEEKHWLNHNVIKQLIFSCNIHYYILCTGTHFYYVSLQKRKPLKCTISQQLFWMLSLVWVIHGVYWHVSKRSVVIILTATTRSTSQLLLSFPEHSTLQFCLPYGCAMCYTRCLTLPSAGILPHKKLFSITKTYVQLYARRSTISSASDLT
jgi:hypothetical protein